MLPIQISQKLIQPNAVTWVLYIQPELGWFKGHFPNKPILPGVAQLDWVFHFAKQQFNLPASGYKMRGIKFVQPVKPTQTLELTLNWQAETASLKFAYTEVAANTAEPVIISSGRIEFL